MGETCVRKPETNPDTVPIARDPREDPDALPTTEGNVATLPEAKMPGEMPDPTPTSRALGHSQTSMRPHLDHQGITKTTSRQVKAHLATMKSWQVNRPGAT